MLSLDKIDPSRLQVDEPQPLSHGWFSIRIRNLDSGRSTTYLSRNGDLTPEQSEVVNFEITRALVELGFMD